MNKYGNIKTTIDGYTFASKKEARRYGELKLLEKAGEITDLGLQPMFILQVAFTDNMGKKHRAIEYVGDFRYFTLKKGWVVEDTKGFRTEVYKLKKKLLLYAYQDFEFIEL